MHEIRPLNTQLRLQFVHIVLDLTEGVQSQLNSTGGTDYSNNCRGTQQVELYKKSTTKKFY